MYHITKKQSHSDHKGVSPRSLRHFVVNVRKGLYTCGASNAAFPFYSLRGKTSQF